MSSNSNGNKTSGSGSSGAGRGGGRGGAANRGGRGGGGGASAGARRKNNTNAQSGAARVQARVNGVPVSTISKTTTITAAGEPVTNALLSGTATLTLAEDGQVGDGDEEEEVCWLCAEPVKFYSVAECNHRTCHVCAVRLRALYKKMECTFCKHPQPKVIFSLSPDRLWEDYTLDMIPFSDDKLKISFETNDMMEETLFLLRFNCPDNECTFTGTGWADLKWHVRDMHGLLLCDLCIRHKKIFAHEHTLYNPKQLLLHVPAMKRVPQMPAQHQHKPKDPGKGKGKEIEAEAVKEDTVDSVHPLCAFCRDCFYGDDELYAHLRERHEECFVCKRMGTSHVYFQNYEKLEQHFTSEHYPCTHANCLEQKFVVFPSAIDLAAHQIETHGGTMGAREKKDKMRVDAGFTFDDSRGGRHGGRGGSSVPSFTMRGGGDNASGSGNTRRAGFGSSLTTGESNSAQQDDHADVLIQSSDLEPLHDHLRNLSKSAQFHVISSVRSFRASECSARDMLDTVFGVFDKNLDTMGSLVAKILDVFESHSEKKTELLAAWNGIKVEERQQFPSLAPVASDPQAGWAGIASGRAINIKKATSQRSSKNTQTSRRVWDRIEQAATASAPTPFTALSRSRKVNAPSSSGFPSLQASSVPGSASNVRAAISRSNGASATAWAGSGSSTPSNSSPAFPSLSSPTPQPTPIAPFSVSVPTSTVRAPGAPATTSMQLFPSLQASSAARPPPPKEFVSGNKSVKNIRGANPGPTSVWGGSGGSGSNGVAPSNANVTGGDGGANRKKKKGKETLFTLGAYPNA